MERKAESSDLTPPEIELSQKYRVAWPFSVDWYRWMWNREENPVTVVDNLVFIDNPTPEIHNGPQPFEALMATFGGEVAFSAFESRSHAEQRLMLHLTCSAPDEVTAELLVEETNGYIHPLIAEIRAGRAAESEAIPWLVYHSGYIDPDAATLRGLEQRWLGEVLKSRIIDARIAHDKALETELQNERDRRVSASPDIQQKLNRDESDRFFDAFKKTFMEYYDLEDYPDLEAGARREGVTLFFDNLSFQEWDDGIRALVAWLRDAGCTDIQYRFSQLNPKN